MRTTFHGINNRNRGITGLFGPGIIRAIGRQSPRDLTRFLKKTGSPSPILVAYFFDLDRKQQGDFAGIERKRLIQALVFLLV